MNDVDWNSVFRAVLTMSVSGSAMAFVLFVLKPVIKHRIPKSMQYYFWIIVIVQLLVPFSINLSVPTVMTGSENPAISTDAEYKRTGDLNDTPVFTVRDAIDRYVFITEETSGHLTGDENRTEVKPEKSGQTKGLLSATSAKGIVLCWLCGVLLFLGFHLTAYFRFSGRIKKSLAITGIYGRHYKKRVPVYRSSLVKTPMLIGMVRAKIVLPEGVYTPDQMENILLHEMVHHYRHDLVFKWLMTIANAIHWFNPIVHLVRREVNYACELACDEAVIRKMDSRGRQSYGDTLISVAADNCYPVGIVSTTMSEDRKKLQERLIAIMRHKKTGKAVLCVSLALAALVVSTGLIMGAGTAEKSGKIDIPELNIMTETENISTVSAVVFCYSWNGGVACGFAPWQYEYGEENTIRAVSEMPLLLSTKKFVSASYEIYLPDGTVYDDGTREIYDSLSSRLLYQMPHLSDENIVKPIEMIAPFDEGEYIYSVTIRYEWDDLEVTYGFKVVLGESDNQTPQAAENQSDFDSLPDTLVSEITVEGFAETMTLTKFVFENMAALYLDAGVFMQAEPSGEANLGIAVPKEDHWSPEYVPPQIGVGFVPDSNTEVWLEKMRDEFDGDIKAKTMEITLGAYPCTMLAQVTELMRIYTYSIDHTGGRLVITVQYDSSPEFLEGWGTRLPQMIDTLVLNK